MFAICRENDDTGYFHEEITSRHFFNCRLGLPVVHERSGVVTRKSIDMYILHMYISHHRSVGVCSSRILRITHIQLAMRRVRFFHDRWGVGRDKFFSSGLCRYVLGNGAAVRLVGTNTENKLSKARMEYSRHGIYTCNHVEFTLFSLLS